jgi:Flp pilus assembly protein TadG
MWKNSWSRLRASQDGLGAVELGLIAPVLLIMLLGVLDFGLAFWEKMEIGSAADAGAQWAMSNSFDQNTVTNIVQSATNLSGVVVDPAPATRCGCATSTAVSFYDCSATCPAGTTANTYIVVNARICYSTLFPWPGLNYCSSGNSSCSGCSSQQISLSAQSIVLK